MMHVRSRASSRTARAMLRALTFAAAVFVARPAGAQEARLVGRLDTGTRAAIERLIDSARAAGLPTEPLVDKALEGASKGAPGPRIATVVRALASDLGRARAALGPGASGQDIEAGASALRAGVSPAALRELRRRRDGQRLAITYAVLSELIARGVPVDSAVRAVAGLRGSGAGDAELIAFQRDVERDIAIGAPPATATAVRFDNFQGPISAADPDPKEPPSPQGGGRTRRKP